MEKYPCKISKHVHVNEDILPFYICILCYSVDYRVSELSNLPRSWSIWHRQGRRCNRMYRYQSYRIRVTAAAPQQAQGLEDKERKNNIYSYVAFGTRRPLACRKRCGLLFYIMHTVSGSFKAEHAALQLIIHLNCHERLLRPERKT